MASDKRLTAAQQEAIQAKKLKKLRRKRSTSTLFMLRSQRASTSTVL